MPLPEPFQFTTSQGGRRVRQAINRFTDKPFNSRPHKEVDFTCIFINFAIGYFQFTTSQGGRLYSVVMVLIYNCFFQFTTSQGGRPDDPTKLGILDVLSIHDLTRRSTATATIARSARLLSIHDLTRRSTKSGAYTMQIMFFQFTTSQGGRRS